jgi:hypothetical protein
MRLTLGRVLLTIVAYELVLFVLTSLMLLSRAKLMAAAHGFDWLEGGPMPEWWTLLLTLPPAFLLGFWAWGRLRATTVSRRERAPE